MTKRLLLIEDEPNIIEAISFILAREGWHVKSHTSGKDAAEVARKERPDVVILDLEFEIKQTGIPPLMQVPLKSE